MTKNTAQIEAAKKSGEEAANAAAPKIKRSWTMNTKRPFFRDLYSFY